MPSAQSTYGHEILLLKPREVPCSDSIIALEMKNLNNMNALLAVL